MINLLDLAGTAHHNILLLQGPIGPFFFNLAHDLRKAGAEVFKINFNGGDVLFYPKGGHNYLGSLDDWPKFLEEFIKEHSIDLILLFGDCRPIHKAAHAVAVRSGVEVGVFEEGYVRPDYVTLERFGVNGNSLIHKKAREWMCLEHEEPPEPMPVYPVFKHVTVWAMLYNLAGTVLSPFFSNYRHHRDLHIFDGIRWLRSFWKKWIYRFLEAGVQERLAGGMSGKFYLVPLQVGHDAQIHEHSPFSSNAHFIETVLKSFAKHGPQDASLVFKQHPLERGYSHHGPMIQSVASTLGIGNRVLYIHDQHLPTLLSHTRGVVVINSTVGLSAIHHKCPVIATGEAIYSMPGLTFQGSLDEFWKHGTPPSHELYLAFRRRLIQLTQINGNYYRRLPLARFRSGLAWQGDEA